MTPFHLRDRLKKLIGGAPTPAPAPAPPPVPAPAPPPPPPRAPAPAPVAPPPPAPAPVAPEPPAAAAAAGPSEADAAKQAKHWQRTRKGMLKWLADQGGSGTMADMHARSEAKFFVAHRSFSRLMEEFTGEELVNYESSTGLVSLTDAGRAAL